MGYGWDFARIVADLVDLQTNWDATILCTIPYFFNVINLLFYEQYTIFLN